MENILQLQAQLVQDSNFRNVELVEENGESFLSLDYDTTDEFVNTAKKLKKLEEFKDKDVDEILQQAIISVLTEGLKLVDDEEQS